MFKIRSFNSLRPGRHIQSDQVSDGANLDDKFQFPTTGKAYPKRANSFYPVKWIRLCFNSLRPGRHIQSIQHLESRLGQGEVFQFPTNGKAYPKSSTPRTSSSRRICFNSLRPGRHIQSRRNCPQGRGGHGGVSIPYDREGISKVRNGLPA